MAGATAIGLFSDRIILSLSFRAAPGNREMPRGADEAVPMERSGIGREPRLGDGIL